jgi:hypothetical protein
LRPRSIITAILLVIGVCLFGHATLASDAGFSDKRTFWKPLLKWPAECDEWIAMREMSPDAGVEVHQLSPDRAVVVVTCDVAAYQMAYRAWSVERRAEKVTATPLFLPWGIKLGEAHYGTTLLKDFFGLVDFPEAGRMAVLTKGRGIGDCGTAAVYDVAGWIARLVSLRWQKECDGKTTSENWPITPADETARANGPRTDETAARALAITEDALPSVSWFADTLQRSDFNCDGDADEILGGVEIPWDGPPSFVLAMVSGNKASHWRFAIDSERQDALCGLDVRVELSNPTAGQCPVISLDDGLCDRLHLTWDKATDTPRMERN